MSDGNSSPAGCVRCGAGSCVNLASPDRAHCPWNTDARTREKIAASGSNTNPGTKGGTWGGILALVLVIGGCSAIFNSGDDGDSGDQSWDAEQRRPRP